MSTPNADSLFRESAFAFAGMGRCRLLPSPIAALRGACPFSVCPTRCQLQAASCLRGWIAVGNRPVVGCNLPAASCFLFPGLDRCQKSPHLESHYLDTAMH
jgi:hypothetical protein